MVKGGKSIVIIDERAAGLSLKEYPALTCSHCNTVVILNKDRKRDRGYCAKCNAYICDNPICHKFCTPVDKMIELGRKFPEKGPFLYRDENGNFLFDPSLLDKKVF